LEFSNFSLQEIHGRNVWKSPIDLHCFTQHSKGTNSDDVIVKYMQKILHYSNHYSNV